LQKLTVHEWGPNDRSGSACLLEMRCSGCGNLCNTYTSSKTGTSHSGFDINRRIVAAATTSGMGYAQTSRFFGVMGMPRPMAEDTSLL
jgi:hypothetical protein